VTARVLVTGSQDWQDDQAIARVLRFLWVITSPDGVLVSGGCPRGADALCERAWHCLGGEVKQYRPKWGVYGNSAGFRRSERMVLDGASICVAFILPCDKPLCEGKPPDRGLEFHGTHGSVHCADFAEDHGIATRRFVPILAA
jgi:YspA, cpYpsA-related SLOG family